MESILPGAAAALCLALAWSMLRRFLARHRLHELIWGVTFLAFGLAAGTELYAGELGWTPALVRVYYLAGASLSVGFLALGTLVLLVPRRIALVALGVVLVQSVFMVFLVLRSSVDPAAVEVAGWSALSKDASLRALALTINILGTIVVLVGTFGSAYGQWAGGNGSRAGGVLLIGIGTLVVATGGSLTRFGHHLLYGPMVLGLLVIFAGYRRVVGGGGRPASSSPDDSSPSESAAIPADATIPASEAEGAAWQSHAKR